MHASSATIIVILIYPRSCINEVYMARKTVKSIAQYDIIETVQESPEWFLYKALDNETKNIVLIKIWYPGFDWLDEALNEFFNRLSSLRFIEHKYLLPILDFGKHEKTPYIVFPDTQAKSLRDYFSLPTINSKLILGLFYKIAEALGFLHGQDIIHGLLTPENILVDAEHSPRLMDYGLSDILKKVLLENIQAGFINLSISNVKYTSPEQLLGRNPTLLSDIYTFGLLFYFGAFGEYLFEGKTAPETAILRLKPGEKWLRKKADNISESTLRFLRKCLQIEPENRYKGFPEILKVLERMANSRRSHVRPIRKSPTSVTHKGGNSVGVYFGLALVLFIGIFFLWHVFFNVPAISPQPEISPTHLQSHDADIPTTTPGIPEQFPIPLETTPVGQDAVATIVPASQPNSLRHKPALEGEAVTASYRTITLSDLQYIQEFSRLGTGKPEDVDISLDQQFYAIASSAGVFVYDGKDNTLKTWLDPQGWATSVQFSPDGNVLAIGLLSGEIQIWDWQADLQSAKFLGHTAKISKLLFSNNGRYLYSASYDQNITMWDMQTMRQIHTIRAHAAPVNDISIANDGRTLASCSQDGYVRLWDLSKGAMLYAFPFAGKVEAVAFSSDGEYLAAGGESGFIRQWIVKSLQPRTDLIPVQNKIWTIQYIENNTRIFIGMNGGVFRILLAAQKTYPGVPLEFNIPQIAPKLVDALGSQFKFDEAFALFGNGNENISIRWDGTVRNKATFVWAAAYDSLDKLFFLPDATFVATSGKRSMITVWNIMNNQAVFKSTSEADLPFGDPISPDNSTITIIVPKIIRSQSDSQITHYIDIYQRVGIMNASKIDLSEAVPGGTVSYARNGSILVSGNLAGSKAWDFGSGQDIFYTPNSNTGCWATYSANNGEILQVLSAAGAFPVWNEQVKNICIKSKALPNSLFAYSNDYKFLVYSTSNGIVGGFDASTNQVLWEFKPIEKISSIAISPDGLIVALGSQNGKLIFVNSEDGKPVFETTGNFGEVTSIKFSGDRKKIATAGSDGVIRLFGIPADE